MKKFLAVVLVLVMLCSTACAEFPLVTESATLSIMCRTTPVYPDQDNAKVSAMAAYEEMTGVHIEWDNVLKAVFNNTLASYIASEEYPEIIMKGQISTADANDWGSEGILVNLAPYLEQYAPNFYALMKEYPTIEQAITNANGEIFGLPQVVISPAMRAPLKMWVNEKALAAAGFEEFPKDLEGLRTLLTALKDTQYNVGFVASAADFRNYFLGVFGLRNRGAHYDVVDVDPDTHKTRIFAQSPRFRECLEYLHGLYADGLIYQELFTEGVGKVAAQSGAEELGVFLSTTTFSVPSAYIQDWDGVQWMLEGPYGDTLNSQIRSNLHSVNNFCITDKCENIPLALQWVDYFYSDEGARFFLCGVEDKDWEVKEDGTAYFTDEALSTWTETMNEDAFKAQFGMWAGGGCPAAFYDDLFGAEYEELPMKTAESMLSYASDVIWPFFNWTDEENEVVKTIEGDLKSYIQSSFAQAVTGEIEITDAWWNEFTARIDDMGAAKLLAVYDEAIARVYPDGNF